MGNFAENLNLGNRFHPPPPRDQKSQLHHPLKSLSFELLTI